MDAGEAALPPGKAADLEQVRLRLTPFPDEESARSYAGKYLRLFSAKYPEAQADLEVIGRRHFIDLEALPETEEGIDLAAADEGGCPIPLSCEDLRDGGDLLG